MNNKTLVLIGIVVIILSSILGFGGKILHDGVVMDSKYDEAYKNKIKYSYLSMDYYEQAKKEAIDSDMINPVDFTSTEKGYQDIFNALNYSIENTEKALYYAKEMKKYSNSKEEKEFSELQIDIYTKQLAWVKETYNFYISLQNNGEFLSINDHENYLESRLTKAENKKDIFLSNNPDFKNRIIKIYNTTIT